MSIILKINNLSKKFPNETVALEKINFSLKEKSFTAIIGHSGAGKTTLLKCLNCLQTPSSGEIWFRDINLIGSNHKEIKQIRQKIAMIFQEYNLIENQSVLDSVLMGRLSYVSSIKSIFNIFPDKDIQLAKKYINLVGLSQKEKCKISLLSGGEKQRVAIARALVQEPEILLADEPVASLDPINRINIMDLLKKINNELNITVLCNLHFIDIVYKYAKQVIALKAGKMIFCSDTNNMKEKEIEKIYEKNF